MFRHAGRRLVLRLPRHGRLKHLLMQVCESQDVRLACGVAPGRKLLPKMLFARRGRAKSFEAREFMSVACFDAGEHRQLVLDRWLQVGRIAQVLVSWPPPLMVRDSK